MANAIEFSMGWDLTGLQSGARRAQAMVARSMSRINRSVESATRRMGPLMVGAFAAGAAGAWKAVDAASDLAETISKTHAIFGQSSQGIIAWGKTADMAMGLSQQAAMDGAATFALFAKSAGKSEEEASGFSKQMVGLSADLASFYNTSPEDAIIALGAALRGENEPIRRYNVLLDDMSLRQEAVRLGITKTTKEALTPQQ
jgi:hypothetical protein